MFGITISATSDAGPFWELVDEAARLEPASSIRALGYPPHITLARYPEIARDQLFAAAAALDDERALSLTFDRIGIFETDPIVLWLAPRADPHLFAMHERLHGAIGAASCDPHYRPGQWTPHLTLATSIPANRHGAALAFAARPFDPFAVTFGSVECVSWPPVRVLRRRPLGQEQADRPSRPAS